MFKGVNEINKSYRRNMTGTVSGDIEEINTNQNEILNQFNTFY